MSVNELIIELQQVENKDLKVFVYSDDFDIQELLYIDELDDRLDLNI